MIASLVGLDASERKLNLIHYWRLLNLFGIGLLIGLITLVFINYALQLSTGKRKYIPVDRIGLLISYIGFVVMTWLEIYVRYKNQEPFSYQVVTSSIFMVIGVVSLARKVARVSSLTDEDKLAEDRKDF